MSAAKDTFSHISVTDPAYSNALAVVPADNTPLAIVTRGLYVGGAGNVVIVLQGGQTVTFTGVAAGTVLRIRATGINATNTTATGLVALW